MLANLFARRYLFSRKSHSVINIISGVSVVSVAVPVAAMIILLSVFNGFEMLARNMCSAFDAELTVTPSQGASFPLSAIDTAALRATGNISAASFFSEQSVLMEFDGRQVTATLRGVDDAYSSVQPIGESVATGDYRVRLGDIDFLVLGNALAHSLGITSLVDSEVNIYALRRGSFSSLLPLDGYTRRHAQTSGVYFLDAETEQKYALTSLRLASSLFDYEGRATALALRTRDYSQVDKIKHEVEGIVGSDFNVRTREELNATFFNIIRYEKWGIFFISLLVLIIASFSIVGALAMLIIEKRDDITTLRALGANTHFIRRIFIGEGLLIGIIGGVAGAVTGVGLSLAQQWFGIIEIPVESSLLKSYPVEFHATDLVVVLLSFTAVAVVISRLTVGQMIKKEK